MPRQEPKDIAGELAAMLQGAANGMRISVAFAHERTGWPMAEEGEDLLTPPAPPPSPFGGFGGAQPAAAAPGDGTGEVAEPLPDEPGSEAAPVATAPAEANRAALLEMVGGISGLIDILKSLRDGTITRETAVQMVMLFYRVPQDQADALIGKSGQEPLPDADVAQPPAAVAASDMVAAAALAGAFDPSQPRDELGQWTSTGSVAIVDRLLKDGRRLRVESVTDETTQRGKIRVTMNDEEVGVSLAAPHRLATPVQSTHGQITHAISTRQGQIGLTENEAAAAVNAMHERTHPETRWADTREDLTNQWRAAKEGAETRFNRTFAREDSSRAFAQKQKDDLEVEKLRLKVIAHEDRKPKRLVGGATAIVGGDGLKNGRRPATSGPPERYVT
jgi:hypothetical protein